MTPILQFRMRGEFSAHEIQQRIFSEIEIDSANVEGSGGGNIIVFVADQEAGPEIDRPFPRSLLQHSRWGLSAVGPYRQRFYGAFGGIGTIIKRIDMHPPR